MLSRVEIAALVIIWTAVLFIGVSALTKYAISLPDSQDIPILAEITMFLADIPENIEEIREYSSPARIPDRFEGESGFSGDPLSDETYLLFSRYDADLGRAAIDLIDLRTFETLHTWAPDLEKFSDDWITQVKGETSEDQHVRLEPVARLVATHPFLLKDGTLLHGQFGPLRAIDACSQLVWQKTARPDAVYHHSIEADGQGNLWVHSQITNADLYPETSETTRHYYEDLLVNISPAGEILYQKPIIEIFVENDLEHLVFGFGHHTQDDPVHSNDIQPVLEDTEHWQLGDLFISLRELSMVMLYRPSTGKVLWYTFGKTYYQHDVDILDHSRISIFDNNAPNYLIPPSMSYLVPDRGVDGHNKVLIYDFATEEYSHYLDDSLREHQVETPAQGLNEILPNGDLFFEETEYGRTLYFNADGSLRWSHVNRASDGNVYLTAWSRILYRDQDLATVHNFLENKDERLVACGEP